VQNRIPLFLLNSAFSLKFPVKFLSLIILIKQFADADNCKPLFTCCEPGANARFGPSGRQAHLPGRALKKIQYKSIINI